MCRIGLDLAPNPHDPQIYGPVEDLAVAGIGQLKQPLARTYR